MLVPLILLGIVNVLVDTSAQIKVTKVRERPDWTQQAVVTAFLMQQQLYLSLGGQDVSIGGEYGGCLKEGS